MSRAVDPDLADVERYDEAPAEHQIVTSGVASVVYDRTREPIGHVTLLDYDDRPRGTAVMDAREMGGISVVLRSSPSSYHVWNLRLREWPEALALARESRAERDYVAEMHSRESMYLRTQPKLRRSGGVYKAAPVPIDVYLSRSSAPHSGPHLTTLRQMAVEADRSKVSRALIAAEDGVPVRGRTLRQSDYETVSDELREALEG